MITMFLLVRAWTVAMNAAAERQWLTEVSIL